MKKLIGDFIDYLSVERGLALNTLESYGRDLRQYSDFLDKGRFSSIEQASRATIISYLLYLEKQGKATATIARRLAALKSFYQFLVRERVLDRDPTANLESPKLEKRLPRVLTVKEVDQLLRQPNPVTPAGLRDRAMLELLYATGLRVSELVALNIDDVSLASGYARCVGRRGRERLLPLPPRVVDAVDRYLRDGRPRLAHGGDSPALFLNQRGERLTRQGFWLLMRDYTRRAGITDEITPHTLRHSFAAHTLASGADIRSLRELLGHASASTTQMYSRFSRQSGSEGE